MPDITDAEIQRLISAPKIIVEAPKKEMQTRQGCLRNDFRCASENGKERFSVFIRVCEELPEDFSVGLAYIEPDGKNLVLLRCNGLHGEHRNRKGEEPFYDFHIHIASEEAIALGKSPEHIAEPTEAYRTWQDALAYFARRAAILEAEKYFPFLRQPGLFSEQI